MKKTILLLLAGIAGIIIFFAIRNDKPVNQPSTRPLVICNGIDPSGSTGGRGWKQPNQAFYEQQIEMLERNPKGGTLIVFNFSNAIPNPIKISVEPLEIEPDIYSGEDAVKKVRANNARISAKNQEAKQVFFERLENEVLNYKPPQGDDYSYINKTLRAIAKTLRLYENHDVVVFLYSDLENDIPNSQQKLDETLIREIASFGELVLCNLSDKKPIETDIELAAYPDFIDYLNKNFTNY